MKQYYEALFLSYRPRTTECSTSQFCNTNCYIQYSGRSKHALALAKSLKNSKITYTAIRFSLLQWELWRVFEFTVTELRSNIIKNLLCLFFMSKSFNARHFEYSVKRCSLNDWKQYSRQENRSKPSFTARIITKYSLERFLSICGEKMSKGFLKICKLMTNLILGQIIVSNLTNVRK